MKRLLVWDAPNINSMGDELFGRRTTPSERPDMKKLMQWLVTRAEDDEVVACFFINVRPNPNNKLHNFLRFLSMNGFIVFARPKLTDDDDVDQAMLEFIAKHRDDQLAEVLIASGDAKCFSEVAKSLVDDGVAVGLIGYTELMNGWNDVVDRCTFYDLESLGLIEANLPRHLKIWSLPAEGQFFDPAADPSNSFRPRQPAKRVMPYNAPAQKSEAASNDPLLHGVDLLP